MSDICAWPLGDASCLSGHGQRMHAVLPCIPLSDRCTLQSKSAVLLTAIYAYRSERPLLHQPSHTHVPGTFPTGHSDQVHFLLQRCLWSVGTALSRGQIFISNLDPAEAHISWGASRPDRVEPASPGVDRLFRASPSSLGDVPWVVSHQGGLAHSEGLAPLLHL